MELIFASNNRNKFTEINKLLPEFIKLLTLEDVGFTEEIEETGDTFRDNAALKANTIFKITGLPCFADDSGLMVRALNGQPGVKSARYAGEPVNHEANIDLLLKEMEGKADREAAFKTIICYRDAHRELFFEGEVKGHILHERRGSNGFGYDPVFVPENNILTFAQMSLDEKNKISHRKQALKKMTTYLESAGNENT